MLLSFDAFFASAVRTETICKVVGFDDGDPERGGFTFDQQSCYIEDNPRNDAHGNGKYALMIDRSDWYSDDLRYLARMLWSEHYLWETSEEFALSGADLHEFYVGHCNAHGYTVDEAKFNAMFSETDRTWSPRSASEIILHNR